MQEIHKEHTDHLKRKKSRRSSILPYFVVICGAMAGLFFYFHYQKITGTTAKQSEQQFEPAAHTAHPSATVTDNQQKYSLTPKASESESGSENGPDAAIETAAAGMEQQDTVLLPRIPVDLVTAKTAALTDQDFQKALSRVEAFYAHLDQQPYIKTSELNAPSSVYFSQLIQTILDTPPMVSGETHDLFSILQNTAHFFRVVGKDNIRALKTIFSQEKESSEEMLADLYTLSHRPEYLQQGFQIQFKEESLYDYAGFFLTTMGGRLYLFRRDSMLRMVVSYYSILIVDEANRLGTNRHGIDLKPLVDNLISEIENSGSQLKLKEYYLDNLYDLKEKYL